MSMKICPSNHIKAIFILRWITFKRSWKFVLKSFIGTIIFTGLGVFLYWILIFWASSIINITSYDFYNTKSAKFYIVGNESDLFTQNIINQFNKIFEVNCSVTPEYVYFNTLSDLQTRIFELQSKSDNIEIPIGLDLTNGPSEITILHNNTIIKGSDELQLSAFLLIVESLWNLEFNTYRSSTKFTFNFFSIRSFLIKSIFCSSGTFLLVAGLMTTSLLIVSQPISDIRGEVRSYMMQCTLKIFPYWLGTFVCDFILWTFVTTIVWCIFQLGFVHPFRDNLFTTWYLLVFQGPSMILFMYCFSFMFSVSSSAPRQIYILSILMVFVSTIVGMIVSLPIPIQLDAFWSLFPPTCLQQALNYVLNRMGYESMSFKFYWSYNHTFCYLLMQWIDVIFYAVILALIEVYRNRIQRKFAKLKFTNYVESFKQIKSKSKQSIEAIDMENDVHNNSNDFAVKIKDVSRLFVNNEDKPIAAVNDVSLGVKEFSIFGFLGANGAGKTTLIRMITGNLPPSSGTIEIFNKSSENIENSTIISLCPQSSSHLFKELTPKEHFKIYSLLFQLDEEEVEDVIDDLISGMELNDFEDVPVCQLSFGDARKLGIALSFFGPSKILILDEPTASLDPVACRCVQQLILEYKGEKTFILCTHLLSEAEFLCDVISIMVNGSIYTVGTPQYLTEKFGNEFRIDIELKDVSRESSEKVDEFFKSKLPDAKLLIHKPKSYIYSIPDSAISLAELFRVMQEGKENNNGFIYFNCSSSSLEKVFMQIVHHSEMAGIKYLENDFEENYYTQDKYNKIDDDYNDDEDTFEIP